MIDASVLQLPTKAQRTAAISDAILGAIDSETFTYTELMLLDEGLYTIAFEILDGVVTDSANVPQRAGDVLNTDPVRLVSLDGQPIKYSENYTPRIPGSTKRGPTVKRPVELGSDAMVDNSLDKGRIARRLLLKEGWPIRNVRSRSGGVGRIVEMRWLEKAAAEKGDSEELREVRKLLADIKGRESPKAKRQSAATAVEVSP